MFVKIVKKVRLLIAFPALLFCSFAVINAQSFSKTNKIPHDLIIKLRESYGEGGWSELTIKSDGKILTSLYSNMPNPNKSFLTLLKGTRGVAIKSKKQKFEPNKKLSKKEMRELIAEFEGINFFNFPSSLTREDGCTNELISSGGRGVSVFIQANGKSLQVGTESYCNGRANSRAQKFENLVKRIREITTNRRVN